MIRPSRAPAATLLAAALVTASACNGGGSGITKPTDLAGKTVATAKGSVSELLFPAYAKKPYVSPPNGAPLGHLDQDRVQRSIAVLQANGLIPAGLAPDQVADFSFIPAN